MFVAELPDLRAVTRLDQALLLVSSYSCPAGRLVTGLRDTVRPGTLTAPVRPDSATGGDPLAQAP